MITDEAKEIQLKYIAFLKTIQYKLNMTEIEMIKQLEQTLKTTTYTLQTAKEIDKAITTLKQNITTIIKSSAELAIEKALDYKQAQIKPFLQEIKDLSPNVASKINVSFGGGMDKEILDKVWNKQYPDGLIVDDRIARLGLSTKNKLETIIKNGIEEGKSARNIAKEIQLNLQMERQSALRLAINTINQSYQLMLAETAIKAEFIMGVRIIRGMYGKISPKCPVCLEHGGTNYKEYYKSDFGGRDLDLWVLYNSPSYHNHCSCGLEYIIESAEEFVKKARGKK